MNVKGGLFNGMEFEWEWKENGRLGFPPETDGLPSVSHVLGAIALEQQVKDLLSGKVNGLRKWQIETPQNEKDRVLKRGNDIDDTVEGFRLASIHLDSYVPLDFRVHVFMLDVQPIASEMPVWSHKLGVKGYFDILVFRNKLLTLVDSKGTTNAAKIGNTKRELKYRKQLVAYRECLREMVSNEATPNQKWVIAQMGVSRAEVENMLIAINYFVDGEDESRFEILSETKLNNALKKFKIDLANFSDDFRFPISITNVNGTRYSFKRYPTIATEYAFSIFKNNISKVKEYDTQPIQYSSGAGNGAKKLNFQTKANDKKSWQL